MLNLFKPRSLGARIVAINFIGLILLALGFIYVDKSEDYLIKARIEALLVQANLFAFSFDEPGAAAKLLKSYAKNFDDLEIKALVVEGQLLDGGQIDILAKLPSRDEAYGLIANVLQAPVSKFATLLNEVPSKLARVLTAVRDSKEASA